MMRCGGSPARARLVAAEWRHWCGVKRSTPARWHQVVRRLFSASGSRAVLLYGATHAEPSQSSEAQRLRR